MIYSPSCLYNPSWLFVSITWKKKRIIIWMPFDEQLQYNRTKASKKHKSTTEVSYKYYKYFFLLKIFCDQFVNKSW